jgi:hypothetical protein
MDFDEIEFEWEMSEKSLNLKEIEINAEKKIIIY